MNWKVANLDAALIYIFANIISAGATVIVPLHIPSIELAYLIEKSCLQIICL